MELMTPAVKPDVLPQKESHFSWLRTRMSVERTLLSWVRTATALIGFGFTIFQFFDRFNDMQGVAPARNPGAPIYIALALVGVGTFALVVALLEYRGMVHYLWSKEFKEIAGVRDRPGWTPAMMVATILSLIGIFVLGTLIVRLARSIG
jgi:putative membrane protein